MGCQNAKEYRVCRFGNVKIETGSCKEQLYKMCQLGVARSHKRLGKARHTPLAANGNVMDLALLSVSAIRTL